MQASRGRVVNLSPSRRSDLVRELAISRHIWNHFLALNIRLYEREKRFMFYNQMSADLTRIRRHGYFSEGIAGAGHQKLKDLEKALKDSFPCALSRKGFPKFKSAAHCNDSFRVQAKEVRFVRRGDEITHVALPKMNPMRVRGLSVPLGAKMYSVTVRMDGNGFTVSIQFEAAAPRIIDAVENVVTGVDMGLRDIVALSDGTKVKPKKRYRRQEKKLRRAQRSMSRKQKGSINRRRCRRRVASIHRRIANLRANDLHHLSKMIVRISSTVAIEDLNVESMKRARLAKSVSDTALGELRRQLTYKCAWYGCNFYLHPRFARSTGCCAKCETVGPKLNRSQVRWTCESCGSEHDRDIAAAEWLALCAMKNVVGIADPEPVRARASESPKRGAVWGRKGDADAFSAYLEPPANVPDTALHAETG